MLGTVRSGDLSFYSPLYVVVVESNQRKHRSAREVFKKYLDHGNIQFAYLRSVECFAEFFSDFGEENRYPDLIAYSALFGEGGSLALNQFKAADKFPEESKLIIRDMQQMFSSWNIHLPLPLRGHTTDRQYLSYLCSYFVSQQQRSKLIVTSKNTREDITLLLEPYLDPLISSSQSRQSYWKSFDKNYLAPAQER